MIDFENKQRYDMTDLRKLMRLLRSEQGCPWDREQTHESIRNNLLEEAYEAADAIDLRDFGSLLEELGDVLLQALFHADIAEDEGHFTFDDVIDAVCRKLLRRHPHVFANASEESKAIRPKSGSESISVWEQAKREEKQHKTISDSMDSVARALPALWRAEKIQKKAAKAGFDWPDSKGALDALRSELTELDDAALTGDEGSGERYNAVKEEIGDLLFSAVNTARFFGIDPEDALNASSDKFAARFRKMEEMAAGQGKELTDTPKGSKAAEDTKLSLDYMEQLYQKAKLEK